jgi:uncharacterized protein YkwD
MFFLAALVFFAYTGCNGNGNGSGNIEYEGTDSSLGITNESEIPGLRTALIEAINEFRNQFNISRGYQEGNANYVPMLIENTDATDACQEYVENEMGDSHSRKAVMQYVVNAGITATKMSALTAKGYANPRLLALAWQKTTDSAILLNKVFTHIGVGVADPDARWAVVFYRPQI